MIDPMIDPATGTPAWPPDKAYPPLPPGLVAARMSIRVGAWLIDSLIFGVLFLAILAAASLAGAIGISPEAQRQLEQAPGALPTVAPYVANLPLLAGFAVLLVGLNVAYATFLVAWIRGLPGQVILSLQVGDAATGRNLSLGRSLLRAVLSVGIPSAGAVGLLYLVVALESSVPWPEVLNPQPGGAAEAWLASWMGVMLLAMLACFVWPVVLLIWTGTSRRCQGLHDLAARSQVVGRSRAPYAPYAPYAPAQTPALDPARPESWDPEAPFGSRAASGGALERAPLWPSFTANTSVPTRVRGATVMRRLVAYAIDSVAVYSMFSLIQSVLLATALASASPTDPSLPLFDERTSILVGLLGGVLQIAYFVPAWAVLRATLGQRLTHIEVADAATGKTLGWMDAFLRWTVMQGPLALITIVPRGAVGPVVFVATAWTFFLLYSTQRSSDWRGLHDRFVNSRVAREP